ncbi:phenylalanine--tRNA ligase [Ascoidea rubescens DSM 1968]|uniref:Phenylalanine--tRNA ligase, mitochondrial n=1 Tax=Ascoidea rubescens DSM 1968 TaxID=1344418 RepID=A0A1D2VGH3_9ASCO|nr:mitochondrial phenylalanyl-tRNA synthetase alpha subunit [Ascoidea rubescens DSM 1968]ODV60764.1 mitochondrial phenylalanyl-tRNA synthetase alpha subunit [Ascoidea rubescens DSM 1968]
MALAFIRAAPAVRRVVFKSNVARVATLSRFFSVGSCLRYEKPESIVIDGKSYETDDWTNLPSSILKLVGRNLHLNPNHPIGILNSLVKKRFGNMGYTHYDNFKPVVSKFENFDVLGFPEDHPGRSKSDTYYINKDYLLRTHTSAHEYYCFKNCETPGYFITADVYRRDEIDKTHYPGFHQMEGARIWKKDENVIETISKDLENLPTIDIIVEDTPKSYDDKTNPKQEYMSVEEVALVSRHLKRTIEILVNEVFHLGMIASKKNRNNKKIEPLKVRWVEAYFPWTAPSWEIEVFWNGEWLECCGCGLVQQQVLINSGKNEDTIGWAFGIGLDRIAMLLFGIPDIRLFWSEDDRFLKQFKEGSVNYFKPYSKYPSSKKDISFFINSGKEKGNESERGFHDNDLYEIIREVSQEDLIENVNCIDNFVHPNGKLSKCFRITYQSMDRTLTNDEVNKIHEKIKQTLAERFDITLR